jgi:hypothetical protein
VPTGGSGKVAAVTDDSTATGGGVVTDSNDWRITARLGDAEAADQALAKLSSHKVEREVHERLGGKVLVSSGGSGSLYLYAHSRDAAITAQQTVTDVLAGHDVQADFVIERWHPAEEEWQPADVSLPQTPAEMQAERERLDAEETSESLASGHALFEVRVQVPSHHAAVALAARLSSEGYSVVRRWRFLVAGANNADQAAEFAAKIRQEVPSGAIVSTEQVGALLPFSAIDAAAGAGL